MIPSFWTSLTAQIFKQIFLDIFYFPRDGKDVGLLPTISDVNMNECIANCLEDCLVHPGMVVELVCCSEEMIDLGHKPASNHQLAAAMCNWNRGGRHTVVFEPGADKPACVGVGCNKLNTVVCSFIFYKVWAISETKKQHTWVSLEQRSCE